MLPRAVELQIDDACIWFVMSVEHRFFQEQLMDTKYFEQAVNEYCLKRSMHIQVGQLSMGEVSALLRRAQELKEAAAAEDQERGRLRAKTLLQGEPQPVVQVLEHAEEIR
jgi:hypothetical protein